MEALALAQAEVAGKVDLTVHLLNEQSTQLATISDSTAATFLALKDMSEGASAVPRLVTITLKDAPAWQGAWYERTGDNLLAKLKGKVGVTQFFHLHFLCEKTLMPVLGDPGYELEIPGEKFTAFMQKIGPMLGATCALLKLVTTVGRPMAKLVGVDLPKVGSFDLGELKTMKLGESTVEEVFDGTGVDDLFDRIESIGQSESEPEPEPEPDGSEAIASDSKVQLLDFADNAIAQMESVAEWAGVPLAPPEEDGEVDPPTAETLRASVDQIKAWIDEACKKLKRPSDLERQVIGGLSKTVMKDGRTMWLSPAAAARWDAVTPWLTVGGKEWATATGVEMKRRETTILSASTVPPAVLELESDGPDAQAILVEPEPEGDSQLEPEPGQTLQQKQPRLARRWLCLSGCSASVSTTHLREI